MRNQKKVISKVDVNTVRRLGGRRINARRPFFLPNRFGSKVDRLIYNRRQRGAKRVIKDETPVFRKGRVYPPRKSILLPSEVTRKNRARKAEKARKSVFTVHSPEEIQLKAERKKFIAEI